MSCLCTEIYTCSDCEDKEKWSKVTMHDKERFIMFGYKVRDTKGNILDLDALEDSDYFLDKYDMTVGDIPRDVRKRAGLTIKPVIDDEHDWYRDVLFRKLIDGMFTLIKSIKSYG